MRAGRTVRGGVLAGLVALAAASGGCSTMDNTTKGVGLGAVGGAGLGTLIGAATGNPKTGAVVGGLVGAAGGGAIGNAIDRDDQHKREERQTAVAVAQAQAAEAQAAQQRMGLSDVVRMAQAGHDEQVIINQIKNSGSTFQLSAADLDFLKVNNVPPRVIVEMQNARAAPAAVYTRRPRTVVVQEPQTVIYREPPPVILYGPPPPPPPVIYAGGHFHGRW